MNCLVTGGAGFIGSHIVDALIDKGFHVRVLDNFFSGKRENLSHIRKNLEIHEGDIRDRGTVDRLTRDIDFVFHQAALKFVPQSFKNPEEYNEVNVQGTLYLLEAARKHKVKKLIYASSSSVYGDSEKLPKAETDAVNPISPYAITKLAAEHYCLLFTKTYQLPTASLRYFNVFGPRQVLNDGYSNVIPQFIFSALNNEPPPVYGDGRQSRDFTYVGNVVSANMLAMEKLEENGVFNVGMGERHDLLTIIEMLNRILNKRIDPQFLPPQKGDVRHTHADIVRIREKLGYRSELTFEEGLRRTVTWFLKCR